MNRPDIYAGRHVGPLGPFRVQKDAPGGRWAPWEYRRPNGETGGPYATPKAAYEAACGQALAELEPCMAAARAQGRVHRLIRLKLLAAIAQQRLGQIGAAQKGLVKALVLAAPGGYVRMFLDEGPVLLRLLQA